MQSRAPLPANGEGRNATEPSTYVNPRHRLFHVPLETFPRTDRYQLMLVIEPLLVHLTRPSHGGDRRTETV